MGVRAWLNTWLKASSISLLLLLCETLWIRELLRELRDIRESSRGRERLGGGAEENIPSKERKEKPFF